MSKNGSSSRAGVTNERRTCFPDRSIKQHGGRPDPICDHQGQGGSQMNETELEAKLTELGVKFTASTFKPNTQEINVYEQLIKKIEENKNAGPQSTGVTLKKYNPDFLQPIKQF